MSEDDTRRGKEEETDVRDNVLVKFLKGLAEQDQLNVEIRHKLKISPISNLDKWVNCNAFFCMCVHASVHGEVRGSGSWRVQFS